MIFLVRTFCIMWNKIVEKWHPYHPLIYRWKMSNHCQVKFHLGGFCGCALSFWRNSFYLGFIKNFCNQLVLIFANFLFHICGHIMESISFILFHCPKPRVDKMYSLAKQRGSFKIIFLRVSWINASHFHVHDLSYPGFIIVFLTMLFLCYHFFGGENFCVHYSAIP